MPDPKESLCFALDVPGTEQARRFVELLAPYVGLFKVGLELFVKEGPGLLSSIKGWGAEKIFLDLKLHDIPRTMERARKSASQLPVDFLSVHCEGLWRGPGEERPCQEGSPSLLGITVLTSLPAEDLSGLGYAEGLSITDLVLLRAEIARKAGCAGVVCSGREVEAVRNRFGPDFTILTPGVRPAWSVVTQDDQARILTPCDAIRSGSTFVVVGRPISQAPDPGEAARRVLDEIAEGLKDRSK
jgi:orotidine-5'-phosphate decarboxylase